MPLYPNGEHRMSYIKRSLDSILSCEGIGDWTIHFGIEPGDSVDEMLKICQGITELPVVIHINPERLDVRQNTHNTIGYAFAYGSEFNLTVPDDLIYAKDALSLATWYYNTFKEDRGGYMYYGLFSYSNNPEQSNQLYEVHNQFTGLGVCFFPDTWYDLWEPNWFDNTLCAKHFTPETIGWDWMLNALAKEYHYSGVHPHMTRTNNIGVIGRHSVEGIHNKVFEEIELNVDSHVTEYTILK
jgi:hypothetical protein